ncbi:AEC family transporter [Anaeroarcus burkinensis]|uniref:AEC family transporter n=1 Tax=Anaeroarcus burkinensis TaxID=82376 RepID=UPI00041ED4A1|nr:transporter [Anaeroarcus burkinensis]
MMDIQTKLLYLVIDLLLPLAIGQACRSQTRLNASFFQRMIILNICLVYPVLAALTIWSLRLNHELIGLPVMGVLLCIIPGAAAYLLVERKFDSELDKGSYLLSAMLSNTATLGGLCTYIMYGEAGFAYTQMAVILQNVVMFMFCFPLAQYYYQKSIGRPFDRQSVISLFINRNQLPVVGMAIGVALNVSGVVRPYFLEVLVDPLVHLGAWTALVPIGYSIDLYGMRRYYGKILDLLPIKLVLTPLAAYVLAKFVFEEPVLINTIVILAAMPTAINAVVAVQLNKLNVDLATASFVLTTAACLLVALPILFVVLS